MIWLQSVLKKQQPIIIYKAYGRTNGRTKMNFQNIENTHIIMTKFTISIATKISKISQPLLKPTEVKNNRKNNKSQMAVLKVFQKTSGNLFKIE